VISRGDGNFSQSFRWLHALIRGLGASGIIVQIWGVRYVHLHPAILFFSMAWFAFALMFVPGLALGEWIFLAGRPTHRRSLVLDSLFAAALVGWAITILAAWAMSFASTQ